MWITTATLHFEGNAAKWWQAYKQNHTLGSWTTFCAEVEEKFGADDFRTAMTELLALKQTRSVEDYTAAFQGLQFDITMYNCNYHDMFFTTHYISGLKEDIRATVEPQMLATVDKVALIAKVQQGVLERSKTKYQRNTLQPRQPQHQQRADTKQTKHQPMHSYGETGNLETTEELMAYATPMETNLNQDMLKSVRKKQNLIPMLWLSMT